MEMDKIKQKFNSMCGKMGDSDTYVEYENGTMYGMNKNSCHAMDLNNGKVCKMSYTMNDDNMELGEMEEDEICECAKMLMAMIPDYMNKMTSNYSILSEEMSNHKKQMMDKEEELNKVKKEKETADENMVKEKEKMAKDKKDMEEKCSLLENSLKDKEEKINEFSKQISELKLIDSAKELLKQDKFSFLSEGDKEELLKKVSEVDTIELFEKEVKLFSFDKVQKSNNFSFMSIEGLREPKENKDSKETGIKTVYDKLKK